MTMIRPQGRFSEVFVPELLRYSSILILGAGIGLLSTVVSPLIALVGTAGFTALAILLYVNAFSCPEALVKQRDISSEASASQHRFLFLLCYLSFFFSVTIPKSGRTISGVPITSANILILCSFILWFFSMFFSKRLFSQIPLFKLLLLFMGYGAINSFISVLYHNPPKMILVEFAAFFGFIPVYFLICTVIKTRFRMTAFLVIIILSLMLVCLYGELQLRRGFEDVAVPGITEQYNMVRYAEFGGRWNYIEGERQKLYSTFQNGNIFGGHLAMFLPLLGGIIFATQAKWKKILLLGIFALIWRTLFLTYSRGALLGAIIGIVTFAAIARKIRFRAFGIVLIFIITLFVFVNQYADRPEFARYNIRRFSENPDQFSAGRLQRVKSAMIVFKELPIMQKFFGIGLGGTIIVDNLYAYWLVKLGIVGLLLLIGLLIKLLLTLLKWRASIPDIRLQGLINGGIAGLVASLVHNIADVLWLFPPLAPNFWFLAGLTMSIGIIGSQMNQAESSPVTIKKNIFKK